MLYPVLPNCTFGKDDQYKAGDLVELTPAEAAPFIGYVLDEATSKDNAANRQSVLDQWAKEDAQKEKERQAITDKWAEEDAKAEADRLATAEVTPAIVAPVQKQASQEQARKAKA